MWVPHRAAVFDVWADQTLIDIALDLLGSGFFLLDESKLAVCFYWLSCWCVGSRRGCLICLCQGVLLMVVLWVSSCILYELSMGNFDLLMCITSHLEGLKVICQDIFVSVLIDFPVEHCIIGEKFEGGSRDLFKHHASYVHCWVE